MKKLSRYIVKTSKELNELTKDFRDLGYNVITYGNKVRELERGDHTIVITKEA